MNIGPKFSKLFYTRLCIVDSLIREFKKKKKVLVVQLHAMDNIGNNVMLLFFVVVLIVSAMHVNVIRMKISQLNEYLY